MVCPKFVPDKALLFVAVILLTLWSVGGEDNRVPLRILGLFPYRGSAWNGEYVIPAARLARDEINNNSNILRGYKLELIEADSRCSRDPGLRAFVRNALPIRTDCPLVSKPVAVLGAGCSSSTIPIASLTGRDCIRIPQLSYGATSAFLSFKHTYPYFYRAVPTDTFTIAAKIRLMEKFNWRRYGIHNFGIDDTNQIVTEHAITTLRIELERHLPDSEEIYWGDSRDALVGDYYKNQLIFTKDMIAAHMRVGMLYGSLRNVESFFCFLYRQKLTYPQVVWITSNQGGDWYNTASSECSEEEIRQATHGTIHFDYQLNTSSPEDIINVTNKTFAQYYEDYINESEKYAMEVGDNNTSSLPSLLNSWATVAYDSMWALGLALDRAEKSLNSKHLTLLNSSDTVSSTILKELQDVVFNGASGFIRFDKEHKREMAIQVQQVQHGCLVAIGSYSPSRNTAHLGKLILNESALLWSIDNPPLDDFTTETVIASRWAGILMLVLLVIGFIWNSFSLIVNFCYQHFHSIKASSPPLNYMIFAGNNMLLLTGIVVVIKSLKEFDVVMHATLCRTHNWLFDIGLLLLLNTTLLKSWRIYQIFHSFNHKPSKLITDNVFLTVTIVLIVFNTLCRLVFVLVDAKNAVMVKVLPSKDQVRRRIVYCPVWDLWGIFTIPHFVIIVALCLLAFSIRKIKHRQFNDAANIAIFFYATIPVAGIFLTLSFIFSPANNMYTSATPSLILDCATICFIVFMCQVTLFVPKMLPLFRQWRSHYFIDN